MKGKYFIFILSLCFLGGCYSNIQARKKIADVKKETVLLSKKDVPDNTAAATVEMMLAKKQVPVLCYHHIREPKPGQSETLKNYSVSPTQFAQQMKALKDSGYETILPEQLYNYLVHGGTLPLKPVMLTFDDTDEEQFSIGATEMKKYGFKGVFFIMTVAINRPRYMNEDQIKLLADEGNAVEAHTWDHQMVTKYKGDDWGKQLIEPMNKVEAITGKPAQYFAYPFGVWDPAAVPELKKAGYKMAFILSSKRDSTEPLYTVRRMLVPGQWSTAGMIKAMQKTFE